MSRLLNQQHTLVPGSPPEPSRQLVLLYALGLFHRWSLQQKLFAVWGSTVAGTNRSRNRSGRSQVDREEMPVLQGERDMPAELVVDVFTEVQYEADADGTVLVGGTHWQPRQVVRRMCLLPSNFFDLLVGGLFVK